MIEVERRIADATRYITELGWALTFVHGSGEKPKAPLFPGWPDLRPTPDVAREVLSFNYDAGIGINLGASGLVDVEGDSPESEAQLNDLCQGLVFPCWTSKKSTHRLFLRQPEIAYLKSGTIEFRTGRHQSVLPPSVITDDEGNTVQYRWLVSPFEVQPPPLPNSLLALYEELRARPGTQVDQVSACTGVRWKFRDNKDYILRKINLKSEVEQAGLRLCCHTADANGNLPCFVPAPLRDGEEDHHASGVFNIFSGVLRDFVTGKNHLFFRLMAALKGKPWQDIASEYESQADAVAGRPHSRRIALPTSGVSESERKSLDAVRAELGEYYDQQFRRPPQPKTIHIIKGPPGLGKTYTICQKIAQHHAKATILTLENKLARTHHALLKEGGADARRMPVLRESGCPTPDQYEAMSRRGFKPSQSFPCQKCPIGVKNCGYLLGFGELDKADQLCTAAIYHTHDDFYASHGNDQRPVVVFDENCLDLILAPVNNTLGQWRSFVEMLKRDNPNHPHTVSIHKLTDWFGEIEKHFAGAVDEEGEPAKFKTFSLPEELHHPDFEKDAALEDWLNRQAHRTENREVRNLYGAAAYLLGQPRTYVLLERIKRGEAEITNVRFRQKHPLPEDKEIFILDATANEDLIRAIAPGWQIKVWNCPPIEQHGQVIQIMDYDISRNRISREISNHTPNNPSWLVQVLDHILENHGPARLISFKDVTVNPVPEMDLLAKLKHRDQITGTNNFPCRGHTFEDEALLVVGTPYKDQASIWELAMAIWGPDQLPQTKYTRRQRDNGWFVSENMEYGDPHLKPLHDFIVAADLVQAIGRVRPLQNKSTVFVVSNAPISDWEVQQFTASELFDMRLPLRKDAAKTSTAFNTTALKLLDSRQWVTNRMVCEAINLPVRTGQAYWKSLKLMLANDVEEDETGRLRKRPDPKDIVDAIVLD